MENTSISVSCNHETGRVEVTSHPIDDWVFLITISPVKILQFCREHWAEEAIEHHGENSIAPEEAIWGNVKISYHGFHHWEFRGPRLEVIDLLERNGLSELIQPERG